MCVRVSQRNIIFFSQDRHIRIDLDSVFDRDPQGPFVPHGMFPYYLVRMRMVL
jgi:hypothetical protein